MSSRNYANYNRIRTFVQEKTPHIIKVLTNDTRYQLLGTVSTIAPRSGGASW